MCDEPVLMEPLVYVLDHFKTEDMCIEAVRRKAYTVDYVSDKLKTQIMCNEAMCENQAAFFLCF